MMEEIMSVELDNHVNFHLIDTKNIRKESQYEIFRITLEAQFFTCSSTLIGTYRHVSTLML